MGEKSPGYKLVHTSETDSMAEFNQLAQNPDMSPIIRPKTKLVESMPRFPLIEIKLSVVLDKIQDIILELLINSTEIYLAPEKLTENEENYIHDSEHKFG